MIIKCLPVKVLYTSSTTNFCVISCLPIGFYPDLKLNKWGNFSLSGDNLSSLQLNQEATLDILYDTKSKYDASYKLIGYAGIFVGQEIKVDPKYEEEILCRLMTKSQAQNILQVYPDFVQMVLNNQTNLIDHKKIYNVGEYRLNEYFNKIRNDCKTIIFYPSALERGIDSYENINKLQLRFNEVKEFEDAFDRSPYYVLIDICHYSFEKADSIALSWNDKFLNSLERGIYAAKYILKLNEEDGDTRIDIDCFKDYFEDFVPECKDKFEEILKDSSFVIRKNYISLCPTYEAESIIAKAILSRLRSKNCPSMEWEQYITFKDFKCTEEQTKILKIIAEGARVAILTGSGGTGKSTSMKALIRMLEGNKKTYTLLAPTGIAAKRLKETTGRHATTVHMFIAKLIPPNEYIIIDESSMLSVDILGALFRQFEAFSTFPSIIFVCDEEQLASIGCGNIVQDILDADIIPHANLTKVFRYGIGGIATMSTDVRNGKFHFKDFPDFKLIKSSNIKEQVSNIYKDCLKSGWTKDDIMILSPYNKGKAGTYYINDFIQNEYNPKPFTDVEYTIGKHKIKFKIGDKVINTHNSYNVPCFPSSPNEDTMPVMNGDIGYIRECLHDNKGKPSLVVEFDTGLACMSGTNLTDLLLGYAISIHKSQGTESPVVIVVIDKNHHRLLSRNLIYVAFSRAKKMLYVISEEDTIKEGLNIRENKERETWLKEMLIKETISERLGQTK